MTYPSYMTEVQTRFYIFLLHCKRKTWPTNNSVHHTEQYFCPIGPLSSAKQLFFFFSSLAEQGVYWGQAFAGVFPTWCPLRVERCGSTYCTAIFSCSVCIQHWRFRLYTTHFIHCPRFEVPAFEKALGEILVNPWGTIFGYGYEQLCDRNTSTRHHWSLYTDHHNKPLDSPNLSEHKIHRALQGSGSERIHQKLWREGDIN